VLHSTLKSSRRCQGPVGRNKLAQFRHRNSAFAAGLPELRKLVPAYNPASRAEQGFYDDLCSSERESPGDKPLASWIYRLDQHFRVTTHKTDAHTRSLSHHAATGTFRRAYSLFTS